jgi:seryl-tRNA synthetase
MIDLKKFRENPKIFIEWAKAKQEEVDFDKFIELDNKLRDLQKQLDEINAKINSLSKQLPQSSEKEEIISQVKKLKSKQKELEKQYNQVKQDHLKIWLKIPNPPAEDVPYWESDEDNQVIYTVGLLNIYSKKENPNLSKICIKNRKESFESVWKKFPENPLPHREILEKRNLLDTKRSAKVSWSRFRYIKEWLVLLELALINFVVDKLRKKWFSLTIWPNMVKEEAMIATWFFPAEKNQIYHVNPEEDDLYLIWTSEVTLVSQHMNEILDVNDLPLRYAWISPCYRREVWKSWKDIRWLIRLHQFEKVEMVSFTKPEDSRKEHEFLVSIEEEIWSELGIPYRKILICSWDLWAPAAKKYDLEAWMPGMNTFKEVTSCSNTTDYQARRAKIRFKNWNKKDYVHTLNWTAIAIQRWLAAIVENYQTEDMRIVIPKVLRKYILGNIEII